MMAPVSSVVVSPCLAFPNSFCFEPARLRKIKCVHKEFGKRNQPICPPPTLGRMAVFQGYGVVHSEVQYQTIVHGGQSQIFALSQHNSLFPNSDGATTNTSGRWTTPCHYTRRDIQHSGRSNTPTRLSRLMMADRLRGL